MKKKEFFQNAVIMTVTSLLLRLIGIIFRIYISNRVGAEGMGLYQLIISVYVLASSFAAAGLCTAVTRLCADEMINGSANGVRRIVRLCVSLSIVIGVVSGLVITCGADLIALWFINDIRAAPSLKILTVSLPFMGVSSCLRGYFASRRRVASSSFSQILEQLVRIGAIAVLLNHSDELDAEKACFIILLGDTIAEGTSCVFMSVCYMIDKRRLTQTTGIETSRTQLIRQTVHIALPITSGRYLNSALRAIENSIVPRALDIVTRSHALSLAQFGKLKGMAMPLLFFPASFLTSFSTLLIPEISQSHLLSEHRQLNYTVGRAFHMTLLSSYLIGGVFWVIADPLGKLIYNDAEVGAMIRILAPLTPIMYLESVVVGILKGLDEQTQSLIYSVIDSVARIVLITIFTPLYGMQGFFAVMFASNLLTCFLNSSRLCHVLRFKVLFGKWVIRPISAITMSSAVALLVPIESHDLFDLCLIRGGITVLLYGVLIVVLGCIKKDDLATFKVIKKSVPAK